MRSLSRSLTVLIVLASLGCGGLLQEPEPTELPAPQPQEAAEPRFPVLDGDLAVTGENDMKRVLEQVEWAQQQGLEDPTVGTTQVSILPLSPLTDRQLAEIRGRRIRFRYCYRRVQANNPSANGFLRVDLRFEHDKVVARGVERAGLTPGLQGCVYHGVRRWTLEDAPEVVQLLVVMGDPQ